MRKFFEKNKIFITIIIAGLIVGGVFWFFWPQTPKDFEELTGKTQACIDSGGVVGTGLCCESTGDFPDTCAIGACGCAPEYSHSVKICDCGKDKCFNGKQCVYFKETQEKEIISPASYHIENPPYYREDGFCWGASAIMLMMDHSLPENEVQNIRTVLKSGPGGTPDMFMGFHAFGVIDKVRIAYSNFSLIYNYCLESNICG